MWLTRSLFCKATACRSLYTCRVGVGHASNSSTLSKDTGVPMLVATVHHRYSNGVRSSSSAVVPASSSKAVIWTMLCSVRWRARVCLEMESRDANRIAWFKTAAAGVSGLSRSRAHPFGPRNFGIDLCCCLAFVITCIRTAQKRNRDSVSWTCLTPRAITTAAAHQCGSPMLWSSARCMLWPRTTTLTELPVKWRCLFLASDPRRFLLQPSEPAIMRPMPSALAAAGRAAWRDWLMLRPPWLCAMPIHRYVSNTSASQAPGSHYRH